MFWLRFGGSFGIRRGGFEIFYSWGVVFRTFAVWGFHWFMDLPEHCLMPVLGLRFLRWNYRRGQWSGWFLFLPVWCSKFPGYLFTCGHLMFYQGAPTSVTALFAIVPKVAAFGLIIRLLTGPFASLHDQASQILIFVALGSMIVGAFAGLAQQNFKRLIAYSSIANMGYALLGLLSGEPEGVASVILYLMIYMIMTAGVFAVLMGLKRQGVALENISDFAGLGKKAPFMAYSLVALLFSMSGLPPMAGFFAKLFVFQAAVAGGFFTVAVLGVLASVVASYYYLRVIKVMLFDEPIGAFDCDCSISRKIVMVGSVVFILVFTVLPNALLDQAQIAAGSLFP
jgi:NADH-quinone oxidoreductase subunit N